MPALRSGPGRRQILCPGNYPEGCPTHPAYPGATATIGGAGGRVLKQLFNPNFVIPAP